MASTKSVFNGQPTLDFKPVQRSKNGEGSIPAPLASPPLSPTGIARPPTPGGGPLSSHPATPVNGGSYFPPPPMSKPSTPPKSSTDTDSNSSRGRVDSVFRSPLSPISPNVQPVSSPKLRRRDSFGIRKLLSLSSLRNSFADKSRTDLTLQRTNTTGLENLTSSSNSKTSNHKRRPSSPGLYSPSLYSNNSANSSRPQQSFQATPQQSYQATIYSGISPSQIQPNPQLRKRKSGSWFRRKSAIFFMEGDMDSSSTEESNPQRSQSQQLQTRAVTALKISDPIYIAPTPASTPPPELPQVNSLKGGRLTDGAFAGDDVFTSIGQ